MKKVLINSSIAFATFILAMLVTTPVSAKSIYGETITYDEPSDEIVTTENIGVSDSIPRFGGVSLYGQEIPSNIWNVKDKGQYDFSGATSYHVLYTNYLVTGSPSMKIKLHNTGTAAITYYGNIEAEFYSHATGLFWSHERVYTFDPVEKGKSTETTLFNLGSHNYFIKFVSNCKFDGWVRAN